MCYEVTLDEVNRKELSEVLTLKKEQARGTSGRKAFSLGGNRKGKCEHEPCMLKKQRTLV